MFANYAAQTLNVNGVDIFVRSGGSGPPLLLLHGYPQSHLIWHKVADALAQHYTVVAADLRGYGQSAKPAGLPDHANYSKREMARDQVDVMRALGHESFYLCGHDRGGRVAHRLAMDHAARVKKLMLLDISPTLAMYQQTNMEFASLYWHWFFLIQPAPFPETLMSADPEFFLKKKIGAGVAGLRAFTDEAMAAYLSYMADPACVHAMCEDYRASVGIDLTHDAEDRAAARKIACPLRVLWGEKGVIERCFDAMADWRAVAEQVEGRALPCGHYIPEEMPDELLKEMHDFFDEHHK
ncbi:MAG: alpha/beta hydrolase [Betaproteobacteria bacterium]|nr:alpha/beta hydrolase [Betaproteobacteria bacterium]